MSGPSRMGLVAVVVFSIGVSTPATAADVQSLKLAGLSEPVEILVDRWGVPHIFARNETDLFFAQGFYAARDRTFQFEMWRRQATGSVAEMLGRRELRRDIGARLLRFRGDLREELNHYHPRGEAIITAFVRGINAWIDQTRRDPDLLPIEFELLGIRPQHWTPEVVVSRHQGLMHNLEQELALGRSVTLLGADRVKELIDFHPDEPDVALDPAIDGTLLFADILELYRAAREPVRFRPEDVVMEDRRSSSVRSQGTGVRGQGTGVRSQGTGVRSQGTGVRSQGTEVRGQGTGIGDWFLPPVSRRLSPVSRLLSPGLDRDIGSNNWVLGGSRTKSGSPLMANDPHRVLHIPSLRYFAHLSAPGWNVIGGGEPVLPGISIGHNGRGAWGLTIFRIDAEDLYVYETDPDDPLRYRYGDGWERMRTVRETIPVKGEPPAIVELRFTRHGPVLHENREHNAAFALRAGWLEVGGAPYLASLRMNVADSWQAFREACGYSRIPGENMVWADRDGNIGWQAVGIAPLRPNWNGLVPVPGDGRYEWDGYLPIRDLPHVHNPQQGFWNTSNESLVPPDYPHRGAVGWTWADRYRGDRVREVLNASDRHTVEGMARLQHDELSIPARKLVPLLRRAIGDEPRYEAAAALLADWDFVLDNDSPAAGLYVMWERRLEDNLRERFVPAEARRHLPSLSMRKIIGWVSEPDERFGKDAAAGRDGLLRQCLDEAVAELTRRFGPEPADWHYGQEGFKHARIRHPLSRAVDGETRRLLDVGPLPRGGNSYTVNNTGRDDNQPSGGTFRVVIDTGDWDNSRGTNSPGQGGDPASPHYRDLFQPWAEGEYFPLLYSRERIEAAAAQRLMLEPAER